VEKATDLWIKEMSTLRAPNRRHDEIAVREPKGLTPISRHRE